jgi:hypothetical protein
LKRFFAEMIRKSHPYPGPDPHFGWAARIPPILKSITALRRSVKRNDVVLQPRKPFRALSRDEIPLIVLSHNEGRLIRAFLSHYRKLGVTRFLWLDDASTDGSVERLAGEEDVDLYTSNVRYRAAYRGRLWRKMLVERYGMDRWYLSLDADEFLVYRHSDEIALPEVIRTLQKRGIYHLPAPMIDLYPPGRVVDGHYTGQDGQMPWEVASHFDTSGYEMKLSSHTLKIEGGVRWRAFGSLPLLTKFPVMYWQKRTHLKKTVHHPAPYWRNFEFPLGVLLHFKFFADFEARFDATATSGQHYKRGAYYRHILNQIEKPDDLVLESGISAPYRDPEDLYERGFFADWKAPS